MQHNECSTSLQQVSRVVLIFLTSPIMFLRNSIAVVIRLWVFMMLHVKILSTLILRHVPLSQDIAFTIRSSKSGFMMLHFNMSSIKYALTGLVLMSSFGRNAFALPVAETSDGLALIKRAPGDSSTNPIAATFDISNWADIAEENCYVMLCMYAGNRIL
jgi:hypothetical protein